jgi:hypothetical protein
MTRYELAIELTCYYIAIYIYTDNMVDDNSSDSKQDSTEILDGYGGESESDHAYESTETLDGDESESDHDDDEEDQVDGDETDGLDLKENQKKRKQNTGAICHRKAPNKRRKTKKVPESMHMVIINI